MSRLSLQLLGPSQITLDGQIIRSFVYDKVLALLIYLAVEADHPHRRDSIAELLWPEQPQQRARNSLRQALSQLRRVINDQAADPPFLLITHETVQFNRASDHHVDMTDLAALFERMKRHGHAQPSDCAPCMHQLQETIELYRGDFLQHFSLHDTVAFEEWVLLKRERIHGLALDALSDLTDYHLRQGAYDAARWCAWRQIEMEPWREEAHRQLMYILAVSGERSTALTHYDHCRRILAAELDSEPAPETVTLYERIRAGMTSALSPGAEAERHGSAGQEPAVSRKHHAHHLAERSGTERQMQAIYPAPGHLPAPLTTLIGRNQEVEAICSQLHSRDLRLLNIVGPPGAGKTRVALGAAAAEAGSAFFDIVSYVSLESIDDPAQVLPTIARTLMTAADDQGACQQLSEFFDRKRGLLLLDNVEQVAAAARQIVELLRAAPGLTILCTSRSVLHIPGEHVFAIAPLPVPDPDVHMSMADLAQIPAITLFVERARAANRAFELTDANADALGEICRRLDGLPLALEFAASLCRVYSPQGLLNHLKHGCLLLAGGSGASPRRHQSLRDALDWSYALLGPEEQMLFRRMAIINDALMEEASAELCKVARALSLDILTGLTSLVDKSLIRLERDARGEPRFSMLRTIREFALERLRASNEDEHYAQMSAVNVRPGIVR